MTRKFRKTEVLLIDEGTGQGRALEAFDYELAFFAQWLQSVVVAPWFRAMGWTSPNVIPSVEITPTKPPIPEGEWGELIQEKGFSPIAIAYVGTKPPRALHIFRRPLDDGARPIHLFHDRAPEMKLVLDPVPGFRRD